MDFIPSKDVRDYLAELKKEFTDFEKAGLMYNLYNDRALITEKLRELRDTTEDAGLIKQIEERLRYDEEEWMCLSTVKKNAIFTVEEHDPDDSSYCVRGNFTSLKAAAAFADSMGRQCQILKRRLYADGEIPNREAEQELGCIYYSKKGKVCDCFSWEMDRSNYPDMRNHERFEHAYVTIPHPFEKGDIVRVIGTGQLGIVCLKGGWKVYEAERKRMNLNSPSPLRWDFFDASIPVEFFCEESERFVDDHICPACLEFAQLNQVEDLRQIDDDFQLMMKYASLAMKGGGSEL